jgi:hypothetical protein
VGVPGAPAQRWESALHVLHIRTGKSGGRRQSMRRKGDGPLHPDSQAYGFEHSATAVAGRALISFSATRFSSCSVWKTRRNPHIKYPARLFAPHLLYNRERAV